MSKRKHTEASEDDETEEDEQQDEEYEIDVIDGVRAVSKRGSSNKTDWEYHVKWLGYSSSEDTWEPHDMLEESVPDLLDRLWKNIDPKGKNPDFAVGVIHKPTKDWIAKERRDREKRGEDEKEDKRKNKEEKKRKRSTHTLDDVAFEVRKEDGLHAETERLRSGRKNKRGTFDSTKEFVDIINNGAKSPSDIDPGSDGASETPLADQVPKPRERRGYVKRKETLYTHERPMASGSKSASAHVKKRKHSAGGRIVPESSESEEDRRASQRRKRRSLDPSLIKGLKDASPVAPIEMPSRKGQGKARASVESSQHRSASSRQGSLNARNETIPQLPPASKSPSVTSDQEDSSLFGSSPHKSPPKPAPFQTSSAPAARNDKSKRRATMPMPLNWTDSSGLPGKLKAAGIEKPTKPTPSTSKQLSSIKPNGAMSRPSASPIMQQGPRSAITPPTVPQHVSQVARQQSPAVVYQSPVNTSPPPSWGNDTTAFDQPMSIDTSAQVDAYHDAVVPKQVQATTAVRSFGGRIPKKWKWEGEMRVGARSQAAERFAKVSILDAMDPHPQRMRLNILFQPGSTPLESIKFEKLMGRSQIKGFFTPATFPPSHVARLAPYDSEQDGKSFSVLAQHMAAHDLGTYAFMDDSDGNPAALLVVFPSARLDLWKIQVSEDVKRGPFVVAVLQWKVVGEKIAAYRLRRTSDERDRILKLRADIAPSDPVPKAENLQLRARPERELARRILNIPKYLFDMLSDPKIVRMYAIWHLPSDGLANVGAETRMLRDILQDAHKNVPGEHEVPPESPTVRVIFVHVGSIRSFSKIHKIVERRKQQLVQFYTFGTHHTVPPSRWGIREIFTEQNAVTFGPSLVQEGFGSVRRIVEMAEEHDFWMSFITPSVLALAALEAYGEDPLKAYDENRFVHGKVLKLITDGKLSLLYKPPTRFVTVEDHEFFKDWVNWHRDIVYHGERGVLEQCLRWFHARYERHFIHASDREPINDRLRQFVLEELKTTVDAIMVQPAMVDSVRRFVVVLGKTDRPAQTEQCAFEWDTLAQFNFGDDFWKKEDMEDMRRTEW